MKRILKLSAFVFLAGVLFHMSSQKKNSCENCEGNKPHSANAGIIQIIVLPKFGVTPDGTASFDPDGRITSYKWIKIAWPAS
jgi:hypothetical protein